MSVPTHPTPSGGRRGERRRTRAPRRRLDPRSLLLALLPVLTVGVALLAGGGVEPTDEAAGSTQANVPVDHTLHACLPADEQPDDSGVRSVLVPLDGLGSSGRLRSGPAGELAEAQTTRGQVLETPARPDGPTVVEADGGLAAGLASFRVDRTEATLAVQECVDPRARWWFTGAGAGLDHTSVLSLTNPDPAAAVVDVTVLGPDGEVESVGTRGITVQPGETTTLPMLEVAPQSEELAVLVSASRGRVVAAMSDSFAASASAEPGAEWIPYQAAASRFVRLAPIPARADQRTLVVANPTEREAVVEVEVAGSGGSFAPTEGAEIRVPPLSVVTSDLGDSFEGDPSALTLRSTQPVTASVRSVSDQDTSYAAALPPLTGPAAAVVAGGGRPVVALTAGEAPATVGVTAYDSAGGEVDTTTLDLDPGATVSWRGPAGAAYVVVTPRSGSVFGGVTTESDGVTQVPLRTVPVDVRRPLVVPVLG